MRLLNSSGVLKDILVITLCWGIAALLVNPIGDFPLNDDWSYGLTVMRLLDEGTFAPTEWTSMPLISQALWGALFCLPLGFSFTALRISILLLSLLGILGLYLLIRQFEYPRWLGLVAAFTLACNPLYFALSYTFMTDVPFTAFAILACLCFAQHLRDDSAIALVLGTVLATAAILCRQLGVFLPLAFSLILFIKHGFSRRAFARAGFAIIVGIGGLLGFEQWLKAHDRFPALYDIGKTNLIHTLQTPRVALNMLVANTATLCVYLGLFLLPILVFQWYAQTRHNGTVPLFSRRKIGLPELMQSYVLPLIVMLGFAIWLLMRQRLMPLSGNILFPGGIGPITLRDTYILGQTVVPAMPSGFWLIVTIFGILGVGLLIPQLTSSAITSLLRLRKSPGNLESMQTLFFLTGSGVYAAPILVSGLFDRYFLPFLALIPAALVFVPVPRIFRGKRLMMLASFVWIGILAAFSIATTHDYVNWNRARWEAAWFLLDNQIPPTLIDGGFEFNGWSLYDPEFEWQDESKSWWWVADDAYIIALGPLAGYDIVGQFPFTRWLPPQPGAILILQRQQHQ